VHEVAITPLAQWPMAEPRHDQPRIQEAVAWSPLFRALWTQPRAGAIPTRRCLPAHKLDRAAAPHASLRHARAFR
jgi:hypothetical protein